jgi:hypothetical protein
VNDIRQAGKLLEQFCTQMRSSGSGCPEHETPEDIKLPNAWIWIELRNGRVSLPGCRCLGTSLQEDWMVRILRRVIVIGLLLSFDIHAQAQDPAIQNAPLRARIGAGNLTTLFAGAPSAPLYAALHSVGAPRARMNSYGWRSLDRTPTPRDFDAAMLEAYKHAISPVILLEYDGSYQTLVPPNQIGSYSDWYAAGQAIAKRFAPDGDWGRENGIAGWGVTIYSAINEPDVEASIPFGAYHDALAGLADGVHSIGSALRVVPGGFATCNSSGDPTLRGYGPAIADLLEDGHLDGIDLHTYYHSRWFPLTSGRYYSAQGCFDRVKAALGLQRDVNFYATEFNIAKLDAWADPRVAARLFLTAFWDEAGVVGQDKHSSATVLAFPWNLADTGSVNGPAYAMAKTSNPWTPELRATMLQTVLRLAGDMKFIQLDPLGTGTYTLDGPRSLSEY